MGMICDTRGLYIHMYTKYWRLLGMNFQTNKMYLRVVHVHSTARVLTYEMPSYISRDRYHCTLEFDPS